MSAALLDKWKRDDRTVSITICDGYISALVFTNLGEPYTVRADNAEELLQQIDNLVEDTVYRECRRNL